MGCCESSPTNVIPLTPLTNPQYSSTLDSAEVALMRQIMDKIPSHCRQSITNLPVRVFLNVYRLHVLALYHLQREDIGAATQYEIQAIGGLKILLPNQIDHIIFADMYGILSLCLLKLNQYSDALMFCKMALTVMLKHNPTNYTELTKLYYYMGQCCKNVRAWTDAIAYLTKAIETVCLCPTPNEELTRQSQADIELIKKRMDIARLINQTKPDPGESPTDFQRRQRAIINAFHAECGSLPYDLSETLRIPDKQTESQVDEKILNEVLSHLVEYLNEYALSQFKAGCVKATFLAAAFKNGRMRVSMLTPTIIEAALTIIIHRIDEYPLLKNLPLVLSYTDDSDSLTKGVREFFVKAKDGINLKEGNKPSYGTHDCFW